MLAGCTAGWGSTDAVVVGGSPSAATAALRRPRRPVTVVDAAPGPALAVAASAALFQSAPVVLLAAAADDQGVATAGALAARLGVPVLIDSTAGDGGPSPAVRSEIARLDPQAVLAVGAEGRQRAKELAGSARLFTVPAAPDGQSSQLPELPTELPATQRPDPPALTVLVDSSRPTVTAAATARASGARVIAVHGTDPRADPHAIAALHNHPPSHVVALGEGFGPARTLRQRLAVAETGVQLPGGGQVMLPGRRIVALYGHPGAPSLGVLGEQGLAAGISRAKRLAAQYKPLSDVPVIPAFEIIATVAQQAAGPDGDYSGESSVAALRPWVERAGKAGLYVVLDLQPGRADVLAQAKLYRALLALPYVGLAIDPEWKLAPGQQPLRQIGCVDASEINRTSAWLASFTAKHHLPQKLFVVHQFRLDMIGHESSLVTDHDELAFLIHMDGQGTPALKNSTWHRVVGARPDGVSLGWKNFYTMDHPMLTPAQTMAHKPQPLMISYQ